MATVPILIGTFINTKFSIICRKNKKNLFNFFFVVILNYNICAAWFSEWDFIIGPIQVDRTTGTVSSF